MKSPAQQGTELLSLLRSNYQEKAEARGDQGRLEKQKDTKKSPNGIVHPQEKQTLSSEKQWLAVWEMLWHRTIKNSQQRQEAEHAAAAPAR